MIYLIDRHSETLLLFISRKNSKRNNDNNQMVYSRDTTSDLPI